MASVRFLSVLFVVLGVVGGISVVLGDGASDLMEKTMGRRLECLKRDLVKARNQESDVKEVDQSRSLTDLLEGLDQETDEELTQKKSNTDDRAKNDDDKDVEDDDDEDDIDVGDVSDPIFYIAANLADEIQAKCDINITAIYIKYSPATLAEVNDARTKLCAATKSLGDVLESSPGFADELKTFADSSKFKASDVSANIDKTFAQIDKTLSTVEDKVFCAQATVIAARLKMSLYGGVGFANGYLCNKVFAELVRYHLNATRLLEASKDEEDFVKNCTKNLVEDITCYEKELEAYNKILPTTQFTAASPLQTAAFTADFMISYDVVLMYHRVMLLLEAEIVKLCAESTDKDENDVKKKQLEAETLDEDTESLTDQLQKLLRKLNEVSAKKKEAQKALSGGTDDNGSKQIEDKGPAMPSAGQKTAIKKSFYREREN